MAIATAHTVQVAILPQPDLLNAHHNQDPIKLKTYTIGPTTHVLSQSPIVSIVWHPLGEGGNCLITATKDSVLRLWEFDVDNRWSADSPALAVDLKKLMIANSEQDDVAPYRPNRNKVFTSDAAGMEIAAVCFGGGGYLDEAPWSAMTLWVAMTDGDVYALCPFLPAKFQPPTDLLEKLSAGTLEKESSMDESEDGTYGNRQTEDQLKWLHDLDSQQPTMTQSNDALHQVETYKRPTALSSFPRLQGPFEMLPGGLDQDLELTDIHVIPATSDPSDQSESFSDETESEWEKTEEERLSCALISLLTREGRVYNCIDLQGVEAQWLPRKAPTRTVDAPPDPYLIVLEALDTLKPGEDFPSEWPTFTSDTQSRYSLFITNSRAVYHLSLLPWLHNLEQELQSISTSGVNVRLSTLRSTTSSIRTRVLSLLGPNQDFDTDPVVPTALVFSDSDLGHFLLTTLESRPQAASLSDATPIDSADNYDSPAFLDQSAELQQIRSSLAYPPYQPSSAFYSPSTLPKFTQTHVPARHRALLDKDIVLSTATLDIFTEAHRVLSRETHALGSAAADLFRRCTTLLEILQTQINSVQQVEDRIEDVTVHEGGASMEDAIARRIERVREKQEGLDRRCEELKRRLREETAGRDLSPREREWAAEIKAVAAKVLAKEGEEGVEAGDGEKREGEQLGRFKEVGLHITLEMLGEISQQGARLIITGKQVQKYTRELLQQAKEAVDEVASQNGVEQTSSSSVDDTRNTEADAEPTTQIPLDVQRKKKLEVRKMLEKQ